MIEGAPYQVKIVEGGRLVEELDGFRKVYSSRIGGTVEEAYRELRGFVEEAVEKIGREALMDELL